jgi:glycosyltransferase involved in cell wall biosynthesis
MKISYAITVCNELEELTKLVNFLQLNIQSEDEIVIQYDESSVTDEVKDYVTLMDSMHENHKVVGFPLNKDFATFKNNLNSHCSGDYIFQIDADEMPSDYLVDVLPKVLEANPVDLMLVPRINTVDGLTEEHIKKWGWKLNENGWVNFPDFQARIYKNKKDLVWKNKVHETLVGFEDFSNFPLDEQWCLSHHKQIDRQEKQNEFYETL